MNRVKHLDKSLQDLKNNTDITSGYDIETIGNEIIRITREGINAYFWCNKTQIPDYFNFYVNKLGCAFDIIFWNKPNALPTYSNKYLSDTEYCLYFHKGKGHCFPSCYDDAKTLYQAPINQKDKNLWGHPTIKPLPIIERLVRNSSKENDVVLDCFMGSGTTGVACLHLNRKFIGIEIDDNYFEIAKNRIQVEQEKPVRDKLL